MCPWEDDDWFHNWFDDSDKHPLGNDDDDHNHDHLPNLGGTTTGGGDDPPDPPDPPDQPDPQPDNPLYNCQNGLKPNCPGTDYRRSGKGGGDSPETEGSPLPGKVIDALDPYFKNYDLRNIRVREGIPWYVPGDPRAYTSKNVIFFAPGAYDTTTARGIALIGHEVLHAQQYQEFGTFQFRASYMGEYMGGRLSGLSHQDAYRNISFERDAFALQDRTRGDLQRQGYPP